MLLASKAECPCCLASCTWFMQLCITSGRSSSLVTFHKAFTVDVLRVQRQELLKGDHVRVRMSPNPVPTIYRLVWIFGSVLWLERENGTKAFGGASKAQSPLRRVTEWLSFCVIWLAGGKMVHVMKRRCVYNVLEFVWLFWPIGLWSVMYVGRAWWGRCSDTFATKVLVSQGGTKQFCSRTGL